MLNKIVWCEARGEDLEGQKLVACVILNRLHDSHFPNKIEEVIFQKNQFQPTRDGSFEKATPTIENIKAVQEAIFSNHDSQGALYFVAKSINSGSWHEKSLSKIFEHGGHVFYK